MKIIKTAKINLAAVGRGFAALNIIRKVVEGYKRKIGERLTIVSIDPKSEKDLGGAAYAYTNPVDSNPARTTPWPLNVQSSKMGSDQGNAEGFHQFLVTHREALEKQYPGVVIPQEKGAYAPRFLYGDYLKSEWENTKETARRKGIAVKVVTGTVEDIEHKPRHLKLIVKKPDGTTTRLPAHILNLSVGNTPPKPLSPADPRVIHDPLRDFGISEAHFQDAMAKGEKLQFVIKGFGNSAVDFIIALNDLAKKTGYDNWVAIAAQRSNTGILRHPDNPEAYPADIFRQAKPTAKALADALRKALKDTTLREGDLVAMGESSEKGAATVHRQYTPQAVGDSLRSVLNEVLPKLPTEEHQKWLRDTEPLYRFLRNRVPKEIADILKSLITNGNLRLVTGTLASIASAGAEKPLQVYVETKTGTEAIRGHHVYVLNATGLSKDLASDPLLGKLATSGFAEVSPVDGGFVLGKEGVIKGKNGKRAFATDHAASTIPENIGVTQKREFVDRVASGIAKKMAKEARLKRAGVKKWSRGLSRKAGVLPVIYSSVSR